MRRSLAVLAMGPALMATQCYKQVDVQVSPGPEPMQPVITASRGKDTVDLRDVYVARCRVSVVPHAVWSASRKSTKGAARTESVVYGDTSGGFFSERPPEPLRAGGCYTVGASGTVIGSNLPAMGSGGFRVFPDGSVANGTGELGRRLGNERDVHRAAVGCRRGYDRARTLADSTAVDTRVWPVSDTTITCGLLRERDPETIASVESTGRVLLKAGGWIAVIAALSVLQDALKP
jgi:hypothetical protein